MVSDGVRDVGKGALTGSLWYSPEYNLIDESVGRLKGELGSISSDQKRDVSAISLTIVLMMGISSGIKLTLT